MSSPYQVTDELYLWWLGQPRTPVLIGALRLLHASRGVSLQYAGGWLRNGFALSEDLPLTDIEHRPVERDTAAGAVDDARPDRWGERVVRFVDKPPRLSLLEYLYFAGDGRFGALGVSLSDQTYSPHPTGPLPSLRDVDEIHELVRKLLDNEPVPEAKRRLNAPGATLGGARPKGLIESADGGEKNHGLVMDDAEHVVLAPAFDVLPSGQGLGYQQMRVGRHGADSTIENAVSEAALFGLSSDQARAEAVQVARVCGQWKSHFADAGVSGADIEYLAQFIDRDFLLVQRNDLIASGARRATVSPRKKTSTR